MTTKSKGNTPTTSEKFTTIATKTHDGGANLHPSKDHEMRQLVRQHEDEFMYYSHQETRMNSLLLTNEESDE